MNKKKVLERLKNGLNYSEDRCKIIIEILEDTFIIGKKNKAKMIDRFMSELDVSEDEANRIYESVIEIIGSGIKERLAHPFKDLDN
ncbi:MAG: hypothetical protein IKF01_04315 [Bacilli bacterium]|nr:hypothetical protein [Bacilli bacterium]MBR2841077.1 hypothetical protein [Bacilli bacterium]